jgi:hypothetical protein
MYTDDLSLAAVGVDDFVALLIAERVVMTRLKMKMAIAAKRVVGTSFEWLGIIFIPFAGLVFLPRNKLLRTLEALRRADAGQLTNTDFRSLLGLLEHVKGIFRLSREWMHGLWRELNKEADPAACIAHRGWARAKLQRWIEMLSRSGGRTLFEVLKPGAEWLTTELARVPSVSYWMVISTDAARVHDIRLRRGLGGFCHGFYFHFAVGALGMKLLPIGILELLALAFALLTFALVIPGDALLRIETDSLSAAFTLADEVARTTAGQVAYGELLKCRAFGLLRAKAYVKHIFGDCNLAADLASRGLIAELKRLCLQLGVKPVALLPPPEAERIYIATLRAAAEEAEEVRAFNDALMAGALAPQRRDPQIGTSSS